MEELHDDEAVHIPLITSSAQGLDSSITTVSTSAGNQNQPALLVPLSDDSTYTDSPRTATLTSNNVVSLGALTDNSLGQVFQGLSLSEREQLVRQQLAQFVMQSSTRPSHAQMAQHGHLQHSHAHSHPSHDIRQPAPHIPELPGGQPAEMVLNMDNGMESTQAQNGQSVLAGNAQQQASGVRGRRRRQLGDQLQGIPGLGPIINNLEGAVPFIILLFAKVMYNHRLGLLVFVGMFGTFFYANSNFKKMITLRDNQTWNEALRGYTWIFCFLATNIIFIYFVFGDQKLYQCLYFQSADLDDLDLWNLLWVTVITDFVVKFGTIAVKSVVAVLPKQLLPYKKKGKYFLLMEMISQFYRCVLPIKHWTMFMLENRYGGEWVAVALFLIYCVVKTFHLRKKFYELKRAFGQCRVDTSFGLSANREDMKAFDDTCPICQDIFTDAIKLTCKHIFCDDCICLWLDREKTCPMCRAHIVDNPVWRDGTTAAVIQFF